MTDVTKVEIRAIDNATQVFRQVESGAKGLKGSFDNLLKSSLLLSGGFAGLSFANIITKAREGEESVNRLNAVIKATGNVSGFTATELHQLADEMARVTQFDDEGFRDATATILKFGNVTNDVLKRTLKLVADYAAFSKTDLSSAAETVGKAISSPAQGIERLQRSVGYLNPALIEMIKNMDESGNKMGAQNALLDVLEKKIGGTAEAINTGLTKALQDLKKSWSEFNEAVGQSWLVTGVVGTTLGGIAGALNQIRGIFQGDDWVDRAYRFFRIFNAGGRLFGVNPADLANPVGSGDEAAARAVREKAEADALDKHRKDIQEQDRKLIQWQLEQQAKKAEELKRQQDKLREDDLRGWVAYADAVLAEDAEMLRAMAKIHDDLWKEQERQKQADIQGWIAYIEATTEEYERGLRAIGDKQPSFLEASMAQWKGFVGGIEGAFRDSWDAFTGGAKNAAEIAKNAFKRTFFDWLYQQFAKPFIMQIVGVGAGALGMSGLANAAGTAGASAGGGFLSGLIPGGSLLGAAGSAIGGSFGAGMSFAGSAGTLAGLAEIGGAGSGLFQLGAALPGIGMAVAAIALISQLFSRRGGPKQEGSFSGLFGSGGLQIPAIGSLGSTSILSGNQNAGAQTFAQTIATGIAQYLQALGGRGSPVNIATGISTDPSGTAPSFVELLMRNAQGGTLLNLSDQNVGRSPEELQAAINLATQRAILAGLQASELPPAIAAALGGVAAQTASLEEIQGALDRASRLQQAWASFRDVFSTEAERLAEAQRSLEQGFSGLGQSLPLSIEDFKERVRGAWEGGDSVLFESLMSLAPAFKLVADAAQAAEEDARQLAAALLASFQSAASSINPAFGQGLARQRLESAALAWKNATPDNPFSVQQIIDFVGGGGSPNEAWDVAQRIGGDAPRLITELYQAYAAWQQTAGTTAEALGDLGGITQDLGGSFEALERNLRMGITEWVMGRRLGPASPLDPMQRLWMAQTEFNRVFGLAQGGDLDALGRITGVGDSVIDLAREAFGSGSPFIAIFEDILGRAGSLGVALPGGEGDPLRRAAPPSGRRLADNETLSEAVAVLRRIAEASVVTADAATDTAINTGRESTTERDRR